jgi:signal transduction histidine kinase
MKPAAALEADRWRSFEDAQREADTMFAQYQLSQLLASGGTVAELGAAVLDELLRHDEAQAGALWLTHPAGGPLQLVTTASDPALPHVGRGAGRAPSVPGLFPDAAAAQAWCRPSGWYGVALEEVRDTGERGFEQHTVGFVALRRDIPGGPHAEPGRFLALVRHELAIALRASQLREALGGERALLSAILDGASEAIIAVDARRRVVRLNQAALGLLDLPADATPTNGCRELLGCATGDPREPLRCGQRCPFDDVLAGMPAIVDRERIVIGHDGVEVPVAASYARMSGPEAGAVAVMRDLRATRALDELRSSFVAAVSHELRTPLALIAAYVDTLLGLDLDEETRRRSVEGIGKAAGRLTALVNEILDVAHVESDRLDLRRDLRPASLLLAEIAAELADAPGMPPIGTDIPPDLPIVDVDAERIAQVLDNLVANAVKYAGGPAAGVTIRARAAGSSVVVSVEDQGDGIDPAERERVFERFYRGRQGRDGGVPGSGLGLYLCRRLVEEHGGRIWVDERTKGASVSFSVPVAIASRRRRRRAT